MSQDILELSVTLATAHLAQNRMAAGEVPAFIESIHATLDKLSKGASAGRAIETAPSAGAREEGPAAAAESRTEAAPAGLSRSEASEEAVVTDQPAPPSKIAVVRNADISDPVFKGLDPWLAARISEHTASKLDPNNSIHPSVYRDKLICLEDGKQVSLLRPYIRTRFQMTPAEYIEKWNLPDDFPFAPPAYIEAMQKFAAATGLGKKVRANREKKKPDAASSTKAKQKGTAAKKADATKAATGGRGRAKAEPASAAPAATAPRTPRRKAGTLGVFPQPAQ